MSDFPVIHLQPGGANPPTPTQKSNILAILGAAPAVHTHAQVDVTGLTTALQALTDAVGARVTTSSIADNLLSTDAAVPLSANQGRVLKGLVDSITALLASDDVNLDELQEIVDYIQLNRADLEALSIASIAGLQNALDELQDSLDLKSPYPDAMVVEGAGTTSVNTVYLRDGSLIGKPRYTRIGGVTDDDSIKAAANPAWAIYLNGSEQYFSSDVSDTPDQVTTWDVTGDPPAPTVRRATVEEYVAAVAATKAQGALAQSAVQPGDLEPISVLNAAERKDPATYAPDGVVIGVTTVVQSDAPNVTYYPIATDPTTEASWRKRIDTAADEDFVVSMELAPARGTVPGNEVINHLDGNLSKGDGVTSGGRVYEASLTPKGCVRVVSNSVTFFTASATSNGDGGATGRCYSVNGGVPVYVAGLSGALFSLSNGYGARKEVLVWSATSATSGVVGTLSVCSVTGDGVILLDLSQCVNLTSILYDNALGMRQLFLPEDISSVSGVELIGVEIPDISWVNSLSPSFSGNIYISDSPIAGNFTYLGESAALKLDNTLHTSVTWVDSTPTGNFPEITNMSVLTSVDFSGINVLTYGVAITNNPELLTLNLNNPINDGNVGAGNHLVTGNAKLATITAENYDPVAGSTYHCFDLRNNALTTDSVWNLINGMAASSNANNYINLIGNPCDGGGATLVAGATYDQADVQALLTAKDYSLILTGGTLVP